MSRWMPMLIVLAMGAAGCATHAPTVEAPQPPDETSPDGGGASDDVGGVSYDEGLGEAAPGSFLGEVAGVLDSTAQVLRGIREVRAELRDWDANPDPPGDPSATWPEPEPDGDTLDEDTLDEGEPDEAEPVPFSGAAAGAGPLIRGLRASQPRERQDHKREVAKKEVAKKPELKKGGAEKPKPAPKPAQKKLEKAKQKERPVARDRKAARKPTPRIRPRGNR